MALKDLFGGRGREEHSVDDLIALQEYEKAESHLRLRLKAQSSDLHARLKLADLFMRLGRRGEAVEEYLLVADGYAYDGFYDKATALLAKVAKLVPGQEKVALKIEALRRAKRLEHRRDLVIDSLMERPHGRARVGSSAFELQRLWSDLSASSLIENLTDDQLKRVFGAMELVRRNADELVARSGDKLEEIFIIAEGEVEVRIPLAGGTETVLKSFGPGDLIGDRALLEHKPWPATYVAGKKSTLLKLDRQALEQALVGESDPRGLLGALREQGNDHDVVENLQELGTPG